MKDGRNHYIDYMKGIAIVFVVYGHTFGIFHDWVYLFHVPVFFMLSGYCWNSDYAVSKESVIGFVYKRFIRLLIPYFVFNILLVVLFNVLLSANLYTDNQEFLKILGTTPVYQYTVSRLSASQILYNCYRVLNLDMHAIQLGGASWFLYVLFAVCSIHCVIEHLAIKIKTAKVRYAVWVCLFVGILVLAQMITEGAGDGTYHIRHLRIPAAYSCYLVGVGFKKLKIPVIPKKPAVLGIGSFILLFVLLKHGTIELSKCVITNPLFLVSCTVLGWFMIGALSCFLVNSRITVFEYIGRHTFPIILLHFLVFKLVTFIYLQATNKSLLLLASFPVFFNTGELMKIVYSLAGVVIPILLNTAFMNIIKYRRNS